MIKVKKKVEFSKVKLACSEDTVNSYAELEAKVASALKALDRAGMDVEFSLNEVVAAEIDKSVAKLVEKVSSNIDEALKEAGINEKKVSAAQRAESSTVTIRKPEPT